MQKAEDLQKSEGLHLTIGGAVINVITNLKTVFRCTFEKLFEDLKSIAFYFPTITTTLFENCCSVKLL